MPGPSASASAPLAPALPALARDIDGDSAQRFCEVTGRRAALLGDERGVLECWIWPLKVAHDLELVFTPAGLAPVRGRDLARRAIVRPHELVVEHGHPRFEARARWIAAADEPALALEVELESRCALDVALRLTPDFRPMWPAGLGGQLAYADAESGALVLTEELGRFAVLAGGLGAAAPRFAADHALPREPVELPVRAEPGASMLRFALAGARVAPPPLSEEARRGEAGASLGHARAHLAVARARELLQRALRDASRWREDLERTWSAFLERTARLATSDPRLDEAFRWAKVAIERAWVDVEGVGAGLVAGLAPSGGGERPGFGWIFDGDALVASRAMTGYGDFEGAARVFELAASRQRADGKLMHELVLSADLCGWLEEYPYAFYKAGNTPGFLACLDHHLAGSADAALLARLWPHVERARASCEASLDEDGLFSNRKAGLAAVEAGALVGRIRSEVFVHGIWLSALRALGAFARARGDEALARDVERRQGEAARAFERFWSARQGRYGFAILEGGALCEDLTAYHGHPLSRGHGEPARALATVQQLNHPLLASDWGVRLFAEDSAGYDPAHYNTGSVFPYANTFAVLACYRHGLCAAGFQLLTGMAALHGFDGLGFVPEHMLGDRAETPSRGVPHQIFSSAGIVQSLLYGLLGLAPEAREDLLVLRTALPPSWERAELLGFRLGGRVLDLRWQRARADGRTRLACELALRSGPPLKLAFRPWIPPLSEDLVERVDGAGERALACAREGAALRPRTTLVELARAARVELEGRFGPEPDPPPVAVERGSPSRALRVVSTDVGEGEVAWTLWGPAGSGHALPLASDLPLEVEGAELAHGVLRVRVPGDPRGGFAPVRVRARRAEGAR